jgi:hypothetical protein
MAMEVEVNPRLYRHGRVLMQFKARGGFSIKVDGCEIAGSPDVSTYRETLKGIVDDVSVDDNAKESIAKIIEVTSRSLYAEYVIIDMADTTQE